MEWQSVEEMWQQCQHRKLVLVARENGRSPRGLAEEFRRAGFVGNGPQDPSPDEIARATEELRSRWDPATERSRWIAAHQIDSSFV